MLTNLICYICIFAFQIYTMSAVEHILERMASENTYDELRNIRGEAIEIIIAGHLSEEALAAILEIIEDIDQRLGEAAESEYYDNVDNIAAAGQHAIGNAGQPDVGDEHVDMNWYNDPKDGA